MSNPYTPPANSVTNTHYEPENRHRIRRTASFVIAFASFVLCLSAAWLTKFDPTIVIDIIFLWLCVFLLISLSTMRWGLPGFVIAILLSPITGCIAFILAFIVELTLGFEVLPTPN